MNPASIEELYDRDYYLADCEGYREYRHSLGKHPSKRLRKCLRVVEEAVGRVAGATVIDIGCGRGEVALQLAMRGARVFAVDPSSAALTLLVDAVRELPAGTASTSRHLCMVRARGERLPFPSRCADAIVLSDVVEHLAPLDLGRMLTDCVRALRRGGRVVVHTQPNRNLVRYTVPILSRFSPLWGVRLPRDLRDEMTPGANEPYHQLEQSRRSLRKALTRAGLVVDEIWLEGTYPVHRIFGSSRLKEIVLRRFLRSPLLKEALASQIFAVASKPLRSDP